MSGPGREATGAEAVADLRHELRTPINQIVGYCEMLLEDAEGDAHAARRAALGEALAAVRDALSTIEHALPGGREEVAAGDTAALLDTLRTPRERILRTTESLLADADPAFVADVRRIRSAAERLGLVGAAPVRPSGASAALRLSQPALAAAADASPARILVVDDIEDNRTLLERRLTRRGHAVECAASGGEALALLGTRSYDLVLLDVMMPDVDGFMVLERIKEAPATRDLPVIMISALDDVASVVHCIEHGAEDYLPKPFDPVLLKARVDASLEKKRMRDREVAYLREVERVIDAARAVESGDYRPGTLADVVGRSDELGRLARVFDSMAAGVRAREDRLQAQLHDLKAEIAAARAGETADDGGAEPMLATGDLFAGRYEILATIGSGGMGIVYKAQDRELGEVVAVKTLRPELLKGDETAIERLKAETRLARRITHPNVVRTHDFAECDGAYFVTMEFVEGMTVRHLLETRGRLTIPAALAIGAQLADALSVAHRQGVIHRDIKPQNLLLDADAVLKVMDFGIARLLEHTSALTQAGMVVGTPAYMSPEQLLDDEVDARSDLFSVGVLLYECLTGRLPFDAGSPISLIAKLLHDDPEAPEGLNPEIPPPLSALVLRLLAKQPGDRPGSAAELRQLLASIG